MVPPESRGVEKGQFSTDTTYAHRNGSGLHKQVHVITIGLSSLSSYQNMLTLDLNFPFI